MNPVIRMRKSWSGVLVVAACVSLLAASPAGGAGSAELVPMLSRSSSRVAAGVRLVKLKSAADPLRIYMVTLDPARKTTLDVGRAGKTISRRATASAIADKHGAVVAVNGDFFLHKGVPRPVHLFMEDGRMVQTGIRVGGVFAYSADETAAYIGRPPVNVFAHVPRLRASWKIDRWNSGKSPVKQMVAYTPAGGDVETPPKDGCWVKLAPAAKLAWGDKINGRLARRYTVAAAGCTNAAPTVGKTVVLTAPRGTADAQRLASLQVADRLTLTWSLGWPNVADAIAAEPQLLQAGAVVAPTGCGSMCSRHPRTAVGIKADGTIVIVVVDGRSTLSRGMTLVELAGFLQGEGVVDAVNLDGGGSSTMVVRGKVVNQPSDGRERSIANALMILPGADRAQRIA